jgi:periplasmic divalent cation tolerance protein
MTELLLVSTSAGSRDAAAELLRSAVRAKLAAGGQVSGPALSAFWHQGEYGEGEEWQVFFKTTADRLSELAEHIVTQHPQQNPEVTAVEITAGSASYVDWVIRATSQG